MGAFLCKLAQQHLLRSGQCTLNMEALMYAAMKLRSLMCYRHQPSAAQHRIVLCPCLPAHAADVNLCRCL